MSRELLCSNFIVDSIKNYSKNELNLFYTILYYYREDVFFKKGEDSIFCISYDYLKMNLKKMKISFKNAIDIIENIPKTIRTINNKNKTIKELSVFDYIEYNWEFEEFEISFNDEFKPYILEIVDNFCKINLNELYSLKSKNSQRMYELCCKFINQGIYRMPIDIFKLFFKCPISYSTSDIYKFIIKKSVDEINNSNCINKKIEVKREKKGSDERQVSHILFVFSELDN